MKYPHSLIDLYCLTTDYTLISSNRMKHIATIITLLILCFANVHAQKILKPMWSTAHVGTAAHFNNSGTKLLICGGNSIEVWDNKADTLLYTDTHSGRILDAKFCGEDSKIAAITTLGDLLIIDAKNGELLHEIYKPGQPFRRMAISKHGDKILTMVRDREATIRSAETGEIITTFYTEFEIQDGRFSNDGLYVICFTQDKTEIIETKTGKNFKALTEPGSLSYAEFDKDDKLIITVMYNKGVKIWDFATGKVIYTSPEKSTTHAGFSPDGKYFYYVADFKITVRNVTTKEKVATFSYENPYRGISSVQFNSSSEYIINTDFDGTAKLWNIKTGKLSHIFPMKSQHDPGYCEFEPSGKRFLTISKYGIVTVCDTVTKTKVAEHIGYSGETSYPEFKYSDKKIIVASNDLTIKLWNAENGTLELLDFQSQDIRNDKYVQYCSNNTFVTNSRYGIRRIWSMDSLKITHEFPIISSIPQFLPNCKQVLYKSLEKNTLEVFDLDTKSVIKQLENSKSTYNKLRISPNGDFATGWEGTQLHVWSLQSGKHLHTIDLGSSKVGFTDFADNKTLILQTFNPYQILWIDIEKGRITRDYVFYYASDIVQLSDDKTKVIIIEGQKSINILDVKTGKLLRTIEMENTVYSVDFSENDTLMLTTEENGITIYNTTTLEKIAQSTGFTNINYAAFNKAANRIVSADRDGTVRMWSTIEEKPPIIPTDSINEVIVVSPNPATDEITIKGIKRTFPITYTFTDLIGKTIHHGFIPEQTEEITLSTKILPSGFYNITFQMNGNKHIEKLIVVH